MGESKSTVTQLMVQIQELQDTLNSLSDTRKWFDLETAFGLYHVPSQPMSIPSPGGLISSDSCLQPDTRNSCGTSGHVFEDLLAIFGNSKNLTSASCGPVSLNARSCSDCHTFAMFWITDVEVAESVDDLMTPQSK